MPCMSQKPGRDFSTNDSDDNVHHDRTEKLLASPPLRLDHLFDDPIVRRRIGELVGLATRQAARLLRQERLSRWRLAGAAIRGRSEQLELLRAERPIDLKQFAESCVRLSVEAQSIEHKALLLRMAEIWIRLADKAERVHTILNDK